MIKLVLDTNILVSASLSDAGLDFLVVSLALNRKIQLYISEPILGEYERVLRYPRLKIEAKTVTKYLTRIRSESFMIAPTHKVSASPDESDNRFLECAESVKADYLVTGNKKHFPHRWKATEVVNAREFLNKIAFSLLK